MVRAGEIVADGFWRMMTEENRTGIADGQKQIFSRHAGKLKMLRRERVDKGRRFAIVLDNRIVSAPVINEPILGGVASIAGSFTVESASQLAISLRSGRLPVELHVVEERSIGPNIRPAGATAAN